MSDTTYASVRFDDRLVRLIGMPLIGFINPLLFLGYSLDNGLLAYLPVWASATAFTWVYWQGNRLIYLRTRRQFPRVAQTNQRLIRLVPLCLFYTLTACLVLEGGLSALRGEPVGHRIVWEDVAAGLVPTVLCLTLYESVFQFKHLQVALLEAERLKQENLQSQLETLKNQVNPHFLFNSMNTLASIIPDDADLAVRFVQKLSNVYRYVLEIRDRQTVSLADELAALRAYVFLLQIRFSNNLCVDITVPDEHLSSSVVPLSLQMLVENAVKHNIVSTQRPLWVRVFVEADRIIVQNNLQRKNQLTDSTGLGLQNIRNRYHLLTGQSIDVIVTAQTFTVSLPLLTSEIRNEQNWNAGLGELSLE